jgi:hypothetical protein
MTDDVSAAFHRILYHIWPFVLPPSGANG